MPSNVRPKKSEFRGRVVRSRFLKKAKKAFFKRAPLPPLTQLGYKNITFFHKKTHQNPTGFNLLLMINDLFIPNVIIIAST